MKMVISLHIHKKACNPRKKTRVVFHLGLLGTSDPIKSYCLKKATWVITGVEILKNSAIQLIIVAFFLALMALERFSRPVAS
jgi:hypothetical protein